MYYIHHINFFSIQANVCVRKSLKRPVQVLTQLGHCNKTFVRPIFEYASSVWDPIAEK